MTIKKPVKPAAALVKAAAPAASGGATIADRFKLDVPAKPAKSGGASSAAGNIALCAALAGLALAGILTFVIYQHWEFLKGA
ncbi:MAG: hypothetical protein IKP97_02735 [Kiritimatiellae bacterium]|nr:hypothetical protein [Kiritimatiellia bacterium]